jgi:putative ABC transport system permease protein
VAVTDGDPSTVANTIRLKIRAVNPEIPVLGVRTLAEHVKTVTYAQEVTACLVGGLGVLGLVLASVGVFGLTSYVVSGRTREIAIRMAVGATPSVILRMIAMWTVLLVGVSTAVGLCAAALLTWTIRSFLFGVSPTEAGIFLAIGCLVLGLGLMASLAAGWRATTVDPTSVLRHE